jgi:hypothetical protein
MIAEDANERPFDSQKRVVVQLEVKRDERSTSPQRLERGAGGAEINIQLSALSPRLFAPLRRISISLSLNSKLNHYPKACAVDT